MSYSLFRHYMPYCVEIENSIIEIKNREYKIVFRGNLSKDISLTDIKLIAYTIDERYNSKLRFYLYNDGCNPEVDENKMLNTDNTVSYFLRLSHLFELINSVEPIDLIKEKDAQIKDLHEIIKQLSK